jgi:hypothetical protein
MLQWWHHPDGLEVDADGELFIVKPLDFDGLERFCAMIRTEFGEGDVGHC